MQRLLGMLCLALALGACGGAGLQQNVLQAAQAQLQKTLATHYSRELGKGVDQAVAALARPGGYLDNPAVRILLPPPLGLALGVARDLQADPQAALLTTLLNRAAEQAVPGAAPILRAALQQLPPTELAALLDAGPTAGTLYLEAKTRAALQNALAPSIGATLAAQGAETIYRELLIAHSPVPIDTTVSHPPMPAVEAAPDLRAYATEQAVNGLFDMLGAEEVALRARLDAAAQQFLQAPLRSAPVDPGAR